MNRMRWVVLLAALASGGCTAISPSECLYSDWYARGQEARAAGLGMDELLRQQNACVRHGIVPDRRSFVAGYYGDSPAT